MKTKIIFILVFLMASFAKAELSIEAQNIVIKKLTRVFLELPEDDISKTRITLRLADLHAERGRALARKELEKGCIQCTNGEVDRKKALKYYNYALPKIKGESRKNVLVHIGHLYEILGKTNQAITFYKKVIRETGKGKSAAEAHFSLAEIYFKKRKYSSAKTHYQKALGSSVFSRRGLAEYRLAWCFYNSGQVNTAVQKLEMILKDPKLMTRGGEAIVNKDEDFQAEVAKDYTIFAAHKSQLTISQVEKVYKLSPESARLENVSFLAKELERLGKVKTATQAWEMVVRKTSKPSVRMEGLIYLAGLEMKKGQRQNILPHLERAFQNWQSLSDCKTDQCNELRKRVRRLVLDWNRAEKKNPSQELLKAYQGYMSVAGKDAEMSELGTEVALHLKNYEVAHDWSAVALEGTLASPKKDKGKIERLLLKRIEIAELSKNGEWLTSAQKEYLQKSPLQAKSLEIHYQIAQKSYDNKDYEQAAQSFKKLAEDNKASKKIREQSAEMALDSLVLLKKDADIESWSRQFSKLFPSKRAHFGKIARTSVLSQTAQIVGKSSGSAETAWKTLSRFSIAGADQKEKITYYKNKIILARQLKKYNELRSSVNSLLRLPVSPEDRQFALENKLWVSEIQLNFHQALKSYSQLKETKALEMARLADLAEKNSRPYYLKYLQGKTDPELAKAICDRLLREAGRLQGKLNSCLPYLKKDKAWFASLQMHFLAKHKNFSRFEKDMKRYDLMSTGPGQLIRRKNELTKVELSLVKLQKHRLDGRSHRVARSIKQRVGRINRFEKKIKAPTESGDWYLQTLLLSHLEKEYKRFYDELLSLPMPKGLAANEQQEYLGILNQQAAPYKEKSDEIALKLKELWSKEEAIDQLFADFHNSNRYVQRVLLPLVTKITEVAPDGKKAWFQYVYKKPTSKKLPSLAALERARGQVKKNPLDKEALRSLLQLEKKRGYQPMVMYLQSRFQRIDEGFERKKR